MIVAYESAFVGHAGAPRSYAESQHRPDSSEWEIAALEELSAHMRNKTWDLVERPPNAKVISSRWVFSIKHTVDGEAEWYKAWLVACGFTQCSGIDFFETFAPTCWVQSIRAIFARSTWYCGPLIFPMLSSTTT